MPRASGSLIFLIFSDTQSEYSLTLSFQIPTSECSWILIFSNTRIQQFFLNQRTAQQW